MDVVKAFKKVVIVFLLVQENFFKYVNDLALVLLSSFRLLTPLKIGKKERSQKL